MEIENSRSPVVGGGRRRGAAGKEKVRRSRTLGAREGIGNNLLYFLFVIVFFLPVLILSSVSFLFVSLIVWTGLV
jgi:hypothetical protein